MRCAWEKELGSLTLSGQVRRGLLRVFAVALPLSVAAVWAVQATCISTMRQKMLESNRAQLRSALVRASTTKMMAGARKAVEMLPADPSSMTQGEIKRLLEEVEADEIHVLDADIHPVLTSVPWYWEEFAKVGKQEREAYLNHPEVKPFVEVFRGERSEYVEEFGPAVAEPSLYCKYVCLALKRGGGLMLGFDEERYLVEPDLEPGRIVSVVAIATIVVILFLTVVAFTRGCIRAAEARAAEDMELARTIQANALPSVFPPYPNLRAVIDIHARMRPAREVGGDFYDFFFTGPEKLALVIADVSGKGIPAALFMMRAKATLQGLLRSGLPLVEAVGRTNRRLAEQNDANMFVTAWIGVVDLASGTAEYVSAGHEPPLLKCADGTVGSVPDVGGAPLGMMDDGEYGAGTLTLAAGDGLVLYTDGVTEARNAVRGFYGAERLAAALKGLVGAKDAGAVIDGIVRDVDSFASGVEQADDITLLAFKLNIQQGNYGIISASISSNE